MVDISLEKLLETGAHFGHQTKRWNPKMEHYIYDVKEGISIFDLIKTKEALKSAFGVLAGAAKDGKVILFVGTKRQVQDKLREVAESVDQPYVNDRWLGGTLTNFDQIKASVRKLGEMREAREKGEYKEYTKKERLLVDREIEKLERKVGGLEKLLRTPDVIFIADTHKETSAVREAAKMGVEIVGIVDSNADPTPIDWPIPMNDDASAALEYVLDLVKEAMSTKAKPVKAKKVRKVSKKK
jgi:small subunit ribosomal protein S2